MIHTAIELWYRSQDAESRLRDVLAYIDDAFENRVVDSNLMVQWHLATAMIRGYAERYATEDFEVVEVEKEFVGEIRNPDTGRQSQTFRIAGKVDGVVRCHDGLYLLEHKTASTVDASYLDKLWTDTQIALYCYYLRELGYPIVGVIYNVLLKSGSSKAKAKRKKSTKFVTRNSRPRTKAVSRLQTTDA